ncbi:hypothetical protein [Anabaena sp. UHCC 0204]|uniref:hypothetical protein n=1 Tax=Anabaena sp. UHCC 0204 TaxID=2590009 RepID=UPI001444B246|nr:hypothetical protein [Anabaena sp. UHCC 0204]
MSLFFRRSQSNFIIADQKHNISPMGAGEQGSRGAGGIYFQRTTDNGQRTTDY